MMTSAVDHEMLRETARKFVSNEMQADDLRKLRAAGTGFDRDLWDGIIALGWPAIPIAEEFGGLGLGYSAMGTVLIELGRSLAPSPFLSSIVLAGEAIQTGGSAAQKSDTLPDLLSGGRLLALAHQEGALFHPHNTHLSAEATLDGHILRGTKNFVIDAHVADAFVVVARTSGAHDAREGLTLFLLDASKPGIRVIPGMLIDSRIAATVEFEGVPVGHNQILGEADRGADILDHVFILGAAALAAEILGGLEECFSRTVAYLQERRQFGVPIGSFQGLQHRAARWACEIELTRAIVEEALQQLDDVGPGPAAPIVSVAKARASDAFAGFAADAIQMFGGVGMTDAHDIGFFLKRARVAENTLGDAHYHRRLFGRSLGL